MSTTRFSTPWRVAVLLAGLVTALATAASDSAGTGRAADVAASEFARLARGAHGEPCALQLAIVSYLRPGKAAQVDLVSAVHIADKAYYAELNRRFRNYDALLYEMILPDAADASREFAGGHSFISSTQIGITKALGLAFQLDEIDYRPDNFVHADLTASALAKRMDERHESLYVYFWRLFFASMDEYARDPLGLDNARLMADLLAGDRRDALKIALAYQMVDATRNPDILGGAEGSAVVAARNAHAVAILREQFARGASRAGIFYGVAHMQDFEQRLVHELGFEPRTTQWLDAWTFAPSGSAADTCPR